MSLAALPHIHLGVPSEFVEREHSIHILLLQLVPSLEKHRHIPSCADHSGAVEKFFEVNQRFIRYIYLFPYP
jgi:hypothetical protein